MHRILLCGDFQYSINSLISEQKWFPPQCDFLQKLEKVHVLSSGSTERILKRVDEFTQRKTKQLFEKSYDLTKVEFLLGVGGYSMGFRESGLITEKSKNEFISFKRIMDEYFFCKKILVWGDHDCGYRFNLKSRSGIRIGNEAGGLSVESVRAAMKLIGPPFGQFTLGPAKFIFISTNIVRNVNDKSESFLHKIKYEQEDFLAKNLNVAKEKNIFVVLHDPTALTLESATRKILDSHAKKITAIIHGHLHADFSAALTRIASPVYKSLCRKYETIFVPASWGMMGVGGGFKILNIHDDGFWDVDEYGI